MGKKKKKSLYYPYYNLRGRKIACIVCLHMSKLCSKALIIIFTDNLSFFLF